MKKFENPEISVNAFDVEDVVTASNVPGGNFENELPGV